MVCFQEELKEVPSKAIQSSANTQDSNKPTNSSPTSKTVDTPLLSSPPTDKISLQHIINLMKLGKFDYELSFTTNISLLTRKILELCHFYALSVPATFKQAIRSQEKDKWLQPIAVELKNLEEMQVCSLKQLPLGKKELNGQWVFATKQGNGSKICFKACFVARGFTQVA